MPDKAGRFIPTPPVHEIDTRRHAFYPARGAVHLVPLDGAGPPFTTECALTFAVPRAALRRHPGPDPSGVCGICRWKVYRRQQQTA